MKLLVFHPQHDALQNLAQELGAQGIALLFAESRADASALLEMHGNTIDAVWVHTDGGLPGLDFIADLKTSPATSELPTIVSTESWTDAQCAQHQATPGGANAYLHWPVTADALQKILSEIFPQNAAASAPIEPSLEISLTPSLVFESPVEEVKPESEPEINVSSAEAETAMPYLFRKKVLTDAHEAPTAQNPPVVWGDAVIPGGAAQTPDEETLKKYLMLREQDVAALSSQLKTARQQIQTMEQSMAESHALQGELKHLLDAAQKRIADFENEKAQALAQQDAQIQELKFELRSKQDRLQVLETQVKEATAEVEQIKERVRQDIRKIRVREKELENRLEIVRRDSEALLSARESKIIELKRRLDLLEFNMDLLQDQYNRSKDQNKKLEEKLNRAAQVVRVAGGMLVEEKSA